MQAFDKIVEQYRQANEEQRLYLYMDCPPLREEFLEIDRQDRATAQTAREVRPAACSKLIDRLLLRWS